MNIKMVCNNDGCNRNISKNNKSGYCSGCVSKVNGVKKATERYKLWLKTGDLGISVDTTVRGYLRDLLLKHYGNSCDICGLQGNWNGKPINLILDHIDGDASNNKEYNLRFICPNCDSQQDTYKSKNRDSKRKARKETATYKNSKEVVIEGVTYSSRAEASRMLGVHESTIYRWLANK